MKKKFGLKIVYDRETRAMSYKAKWWLHYLPTFILKYLINREQKFQKEET